MTKCFSATGTDTMNDSIDYVALVQQHLDDERLARQLQDAEQNSVSIEISNNIQTKIHVVINIVDFL